MKTGYRYPLFFLLAFITPVTFVLSQEGGVYRNSGEQKLFESGKLLFEEKLYPLAYEHFDSLMVKHPNDLYLKYLLGICDIFISDKHEEGMAYLTEIKTKNPKAADLDYYFALLYHKTYQFNKCLELSEELFKRPDLPAEFRANLKSVVDNCINGKDLVTALPDAPVQNLGAPPNTDGAEYSPVITSDEETILFTYRGKKSKGGLRNFYNKPDKYGFYNEDVYMSKKVNGKWQPAIGLDNINTESNEAVLALSNDGQQLFIYKADILNGGDIYLSRLQASGFSKPERMEGEINTNSWEGSITLSGDQKKVIFASERPGGYGGKDLYEATKLPGNIWGHVKNLGSTINTPFDDDAPFIHPDGRSLVFSSKGHNSIGDFDIFLSALDEADSSWKKPVNVGFPINTTDDDIYYALSADGKKGYFASAKTGGHGDKDIYTEESLIFAKNAYLTVIKGKITENLLPYPAEISVYYAKDKRNYGIFKSNELSGNYLISLPSGHDYLLSFYHPILGEKLLNLNMANATSYSETTSNINFGLSDTNTVTEPAPLVKEDAVKAQEKETVITLNNISIQPDINSAEMKKMSRAQLMANYGDTKLNGLSYHIQVGAYRHPENYKAGSVQKVCNVKKNGVIKGDVKILVADKEFTTWKEADIFLNEIKKAGQPDAFITATFNGKRYYIKELIEMGVWVKPML